MYDHPSYISEFLSSDWYSIYDADVDSGDRTLIRMEHPAPPFTNYIKVSKVILLVSIYNCYRHRSPVVYLTVQLRVGASGPDEF